MKKDISNFIQSDKGIIIILIIVIFFSTWTYMTFTRPVSTDIQYNYNGVKYQAGNYEYVEPISIEVTGTYSRVRGSGENTFKGDIIVNGEMSSGYGKANEFGFSDKNNHFTIVWDSFKGDVFVGDMFKEISIEILESNDNGGHSASYNDGWIISAPCDTRSEAVQISNKLIKSVFKDVLIK